MFQAKEMSQESNIILFRLKSSAKIEEIKRWRGAVSTSACRQFYFIPDASHKIFRMSDISGQVLV